MKYTREQLSVILASEPKKLIRASAGTGKTTTLVGAVQYTINQDRENNKIAVFTFTKVAAEELIERMPIIPKFVGTIHAFALREIYEMERQGLIKSEIMSTQKMRRLLLNSYIEEYELTRGYKKEIEDIYQYMTNREFIPDLGTASRYSKIVNIYNRRKKELGLYDFMDAPEYLYKQLKRTNYKLDYTHLFVDEVQDIDLWEYKLISEFKGNVFAIGDPNQNIYQFRNSISHIFDKLEKIGYNLFILTRNFRSYQEILDYSKSYLDAERGEGGVITDENLLHEEDTVLLCRYNEQVRQLAPFFREVGTVHSYKGREADKVFVVDFTIRDAEDENVQFVAYTRARDKLGIGTLSKALEIGRRNKYGL